MVRGNGTRVPSRLSPPPLKPFSSSIGLQFFLTTVAFVRRLPYSILRSYFALAFATIPYRAVHSSAMRSKPVPFDDSDYLFELKYDGFRALAYPENGHCRLVTLHGHFGQATVAHIH